MSALLNVRYYKEKTGMSIELTIKYSDSEYKSAIKEKLAVMPNINLHTYLPTGINLKKGAIDITKVGLN